MITIIRLVTIFVTSYSYYFFYSGNNKIQFLHFFPTKYIGKVYEKRYEIMANKAYDIVIS